MNRADRERKAFDEDGVWEHGHRWHSRFPHVFESPNTRRHEVLFEDLIRAAANGRRVLELGCGDGENGSRFLGMGADYVFGIDVSKTFLARAQARAVPGRLEFAEQDASQPIDSQFDVILGRSILHHVDYRNILPRLYSQNLRSNGSMIFMEPLGSNALIRVFTLLVRRAHTPDERSFRLDDLQWFQRKFPHLELYPFNLVSLPVGILSSYVFSRPDNVFLRAADAIDTRIARRSLWLDCQFRHSILVVRKV